MLQNCHAGGANLRRNVAVLVDYRGICGRVQNRLRRSHLMLGQLPVKDGEGGEAEEDVYNVGGQIHALLPVISQHPGQS